MSCSLYRSLRFVIFRRMSSRLREDKHSSHETIKTLIKQAVRTERTKITLCVPYDFVRVWGRWLVWNVAQVDGGKLILIYWSNFDGVVARCPEQRRSQRGENGWLLYNCGISNSRRCMPLENGKQCGISYLGWMVVVCAFAAAGRRLHLTNLTQYNILNYIVSKHFKYSLERFYII